jgi:RHS repeat-associated protein
LRSAAAGALYFIQDHLGSTRVLTNAAGVSVAKLSYDSFGNSSGSSLTRYMYTGREFDSDVGVYYYRARWYDPQLGRFISEDPIGFLSGEVNLYTYTGNNPTLYSDPFGLERLSTITHTWPPVPYRPQTPNRPNTCCNKTWSECWGQCIENHRLDNLIPFAISAVPKRILPPFRVVASSQRLTTPLSSLGHFLRGVAPETAEILRGAGRGLSYVGTPLLIGEGFYDWGIIGSCAELCHRNPCN